MPVPDAFISSGFAAANRGYANTLLKEPEIIERIAELKLQPHIASVPMIEEVHTRAKVIAELLVLGSLAKQAKAWSAAVRVQELLGKDLGMFSEKQDGFEWDGDINKLSKLQRAKLRASLENMVRDNGRKQIIESVAVGQENGELQAAGGDLEAAQEPAGVVEVGSREARAGEGGVSIEPGELRGVDRSGDRHEAGGIANPFERAT